MLQTLSETYVSYWVPGQTHWRFSSWSLRRADLMLLSIVWTNSSCFLLAASFSASLLLDRRIYLIQVHFTVALLVLRLHCSLIVFVNGFTIFIPLSDVRNPDIGGIIPRPVSYICLVWWEIKSTVPIFRHQASKCQAKLCKLAYDSISFVLSLSTWEAHVNSKTILEFRNLAIHELQGFVQSWHRTLQKHCLSTKRSR